MRLLYDVRTLQMPAFSRGINQYTERLLRALLPLPDLDVHLLGYRDRPLPPDLEQLPLQTVKRFPVRRLGWLADAMPWGWKNVRADVIHFTSSFDLGLGWPPGIGRHVPHVVMVHDMQSIFLSSVHLSGYRALSRPVYQWMAWRLGRATRLVTNSEFTARDVRRFLQSNSPPIDVTLLGCELPATGDRFGPSARLVEARIPERFLFTFPAWPAQKNVLALARALGAMGDRFPRLVIGGGMPEAASAEILRVLPSALLLGALQEDEKAYLYQSAAAFVFPSYYEGFGLTVLEALSYGAPVACSRATSLPEVVQDAACLFDPEDSQQIAEAVLAILNDPDLRARLKVAGPARARELTWQRCAASTLLSYGAAASLRQ